MVYEKPKKWANTLPFILWAYRASRCTSTQAHVFLSLWAEAIVSVEVMVPSVRLALVNKPEDSHDQVYNKQALVERRKIQDRWYPIKSK